MICISCGNEINNATVNCPHCGYRFTLEDPRICPNRVGAVCQLTENLCNKGIDYMSCSVKAEAEKEALF